MSTEPPIRVVMVDDHIAFRDGLRATFEESGEVAVVGTAVSATEALALVSRCACDLVLLEMVRSAADGVWCIREIKRRCANVRVLVLTAYSGDDLVADLVVAGADGYLTKSATRDEVLRAVHAVHAGRGYLDPRVSGSLVSLVRQLPAASSRDASPPVVRELTLRERQILDLAAAGLSSRQIAETLGVALNTVKTHLRSIYRKCGIANRLQAMLYAVRNGYGPPPSAS